MPTSLALILGRSNCFAIHQAANNPVFQGHIPSGSAAQQHLCFCVCSTAPKIKARKS